MRRPLLFSILLAAALSCRKAPEPAPQAKAPAPPPAPEIARAVHPGRPVLFVGLAFRRSLQIDPDQPEIRRALGQIGEGPS